MSNHPEQFGQSFMKFLLYALLILSILYTIAQPSLLIYETVITHHHSFNFDYLASRLLPMCLSVGLIYLSSYLLEYQRNEI